MRFRLLLFALLALAFSPPVLGQSTAKTFTFTANGQTRCVGVTGLPTIGIQATGTFTLTLTPQVAINGQSPQSAQVTPASSSTAQATITAAGAYTAAVGGYDTFCLSTTAYTSGTATVQLNPSPAVNAALFGAGPPSFSAITSGTNLTATMICGTGCLIEPGGSGGIVATSCPSCAAGGLNISTAETPNPPSPLSSYNVYETPIGTNPYIFTQDVGGSWHTQAAVDTTTTTNGPMPLGTLTWTRRQFFRDNGLSTQVQPSAFMSFSHTAQSMQTAQTGQDRAMWIDMGNATGAIFSFSITSNVVTFLVNNASGVAGAYSWSPGQNLIAAGLSTGTYLNGPQGFIVTAVTPSGGNFLVSAFSSTFTHANVATTTDSGTLDLYNLGMENLQLQQIVSGLPVAGGAPDNEYRPLAVSCSSNMQQAITIQSSIQNFGCSRFEMHRLATSTEQAGQVIDVNVFNVGNDSPSTSGGDVIENILVFGQDQSGVTGPAPQTGYHGIHFEAPEAGPGNFPFTRDHVAEIYDAWPVAAHGTFGKFIQQFSTGESYYNGTHFVETADMAGQATVLATTSTIAVAFAVNYIGTLQPIVTLTPTSSPLSLYWVTYSGSAGAWTGFTVNMATAPVANVTFNYHIDGRF